MSDRCPREPRFHTASVDYGCWRIDTEGPLAICLRPISEGRAFPASAQLHPAGRANIDKGQQMSIC